MSEIEITLTLCQNCHQQPHETGHHCPAGIAWPGPYAAHEWQKVVMIPLSHQREAIAAELERLAEGFGDRIEQCDQAIAECREEGSGSYQESASYGERRGVWVIARDTLRNRAKEIRESRNA